MQLGAGIPLGNAALQQPVQCDQRGEAAGQGDGEREPEQQPNLMSHESCEATETAWLVNDSDGRDSSVISAGYLTDFHCQN